MTKLSDHLFLEEVRLSPSAEWFPASPGWRFVRVSQGVAYWLSKDLTQEVSEGEVVILSPNAAGTFRASQLGEVLLHRVRFCPDLLTGFLTPSERDNLESALARSQSEVRVVPKTHPIGEQFTEVVAQPSVFNRLFQRGKALFLVVTHFAEDFSRHREPDAHSKPPPPRFKRLLDQLPDEALLNHSTHELAMLCGCSRRHFSRLFSEHFGVSIRTKRSTLRMLKASQLLAGREAKILHVAMECGYKNLRLFNTNFKKHFGVTPSKWRLRNGKKPGSPVPNIRVATRGVQLGLGQYAAPAKMNPITNDAAVR